MLVVRCRPADIARDAACVEDLWRSDRSSFDRLAALFPPLAATKSPAQIAGAIAYCHERLAAKLDAGAAKLDQLWDGIAHGLRAGLERLVPDHEIDVAVEVLAGVSLLAGRSASEGWCVIPFYVSRERQRRLLAHEILHFAHDEWRRLTGASRGRGPYGQWWTGEVVVAVVLGLPEFEAIVGTADESSYVLPSEELAMLRSVARSWPDRRRTLAEIHTLADTRQEQ